MVCQQILAKIGKKRDMKYGVYEYGYLQVHHLFWCWDRGRVAQEQRCFSRYHSDNFHQPSLGQQKSAKKVVKGCCCCRSSHMVYTGLHIIGLNNFNTKRFVPFLVMQKRLT